MRYIKCLVVVTIILTVAGCATKDPLSPTTSATPTIMPLKVGNMWTYDLKSYNSGSPTPIYDWTYYVKIDSVVTIGDEQWYRARHIIYDNVSAYDSTEYYYTNRDDGLWIRETPGGTAYLKAKYPATPSNVYASFNEFFGSIPSVTVVDTGMVVSLPQGNYRCYYYRALPAATLEFNEYYQPNIGWVTSIWRSYDGASWYTALTFQLEARNF
jgi:hypothetical protein